MNADGTVIGRYFINQPIEKDHMHHLIKRLRLKYKQSGKRKKGYMPKIWAKINGLNIQIVNNTVNQIRKIIEKNNVDTVVFEYLNFKGKKKKVDFYKLIMWVYRKIQIKVEEKAHSLGCNFTRVCAKNTSCLAFDGSGFVKRDDKNKAIAYFKNGKAYNCDLSASYNIGARYFIRKYKNHLTEKNLKALIKKVPMLNKTSKCTYSDYITLLKVI